MIGIAVHGGAGALRSLDAAKEREYREVLRESIEVGFGVLSRRGSALEAVEAAVKVLEDSPLFNAGRGSVLTKEGTVEMDASIMDGSSLRAGAVAAITGVKNPIEAARLAMERSPHVLLVGEAATRWAKQEGLSIKPLSYFVTPERQRQSQLGQLGTVGAVAVDTFGNLAAATSTGGTANKWEGRVGDSAIIGAGTYAKNAYAAVSCTGHGEYFMRTLAAYRVIALMELRNYSIEQSVKEVLEEITNLGGKGGLIAIDAQGKVVMLKNTPSMPRAMKTSEEHFIALF